MTLEYTGWRNVAYQGREQFSLLSPSVFVYAVCFFLLEIAYLTRREEWGAGGGGGIDASGRRGTNPPGISGTWKFGLTCFSTALAGRRSAVEIGSLGVTVVLRIV